MSGCCRPRCSASTSRRSARAPPRRSRRCWPASRRPTCRPRSAPRSPRRWPAGKTIAVMMAYADRLERFTRWYVQLWAESLGKDGKGTTPIGALGPVDQHSQLQLYHRRPARQAVHRHHRSAPPGRGPRIDAGARQARRRAGLSPARPSAISSPRRAAPPPRRWRKNGCPVRTIHLETLDERASANC